MKPRLQPQEGRPLPPISLQQLVSNLVSGFLPAAVHNNTQVMNEVRQEITLGTVTQSAVAVITDLLNTVVVNSRNGDIHISADKYEDVVIVNIEERNNYNGYALAYSIGAIEPAALSAGGHISIAGPQKRITTISFSFPESFSAA